MNKTNKTISTVRRKVSLIGKRTQISQPEWFPKDLFSSPIE